MLASSLRLRKNHEIMRVYKKGVYGGSAVLSIKAATTSRAESRIVVVVGKKIDKRAVVRNRIRRRLLGILAAEWGTLKGGYDIVVSVHANVSETPTNELRASLMQALGKAKVLVG